MRGFSRLAVAGLLLVLTGVALTIYLWRAWAWLDNPLPLEAETIVRIEPGDSLGEVLRSVAARNVPLRQRWLASYGQWAGYAERLHVGEYRLAVGTSPRQMLEQFATGDVALYQVRVPEGITVPALLAHLRSYEYLRDDIGAATPEELLRALKTEPAFQMLPEWTAGGWPANAEGLFLPETYAVKRGDSLSGVLLRAHAALTDILQVTWETRAPDVEVTTPYGLLTLASLVEKESGVAADRSQISQVFHLRLARNMRLQTDPTVIYALGASFDGDIRRRDLRIDSPYNTYRVRGLPPTPIALASAAALRAAANPAAGEYLYFVARGDGSSEFSRTLDQHNAAVRRFQLGGREG